MTEIVYAYTRAQAVADGYQILFMPTRARKPSPTAIK